MTPDKNLGIEANSSRVQGRKFLVEVLVSALLIASVAAAWLLAVDSRRRSLAKAQLRASLEQAALAAERAAADNEGDYSLLKGEGSPLLEEYNFKSYENVQISIVSATHTDYCLKASSSDVGGGAWQAASYDSTERVITSSDDC